MCLLSGDGILAEVSSLARGDPDPSTGRLFTYIYETGDEGLRRLAEEAYRMLLHTNMLDPTVFKSALALERELVGYALRLAGGVDGAVGSATYGGTESIALALLAAREEYYSRHGRSAPAPRVVAPVTVHPSVGKAAWLLGMRLVRVPVEPGSMKASLDAVAEAMDRTTILLVASAPNFPYGTIDPVRGMAELASDSGILLHVDACIGGFILPHMEALGEPVEPWGFQVEGVSSISMDMHKYGYTPKGVSFILFREPRLKEHTVYVDLAWPGYPFINTTLLSSRSAAPLAAAWAVYRYLSDEGYMRLARMVLEARSRILGGLAGLGFRSVAPVESPLLALALPSEEDLLAYYAGITARGWVVGLQPPMKGLAPYNIHLTLSPIHQRVAGEFIEDSKTAVEEGRRVLARLEEELAQGDPLQAVMSGGGLAIARLLESLEPGEAEALARSLVVEVYRG
ncbi:MAG: aspartate aminotransferase family protein [Desulfurococcales archaeon]|nr:aspartate aminotransferase family protein [Desulfurococcales archaeon]